MCRHTIPSFASSKSPFSPQLKSRETPHASHLDTESQYCSRRKQRRAAQAVWDDAGRPLPVTPKRANSLAIVEGVRNRFFLTTTAAEAIGHVCQTYFECIIRHISQTHFDCTRVPCKPPGELELGVVQEARTWRPIPLRANLLQRPAELPHEKIFSSDQPSCHTKRSEAEPTTNSQYSSFRDRERSLDRESLRRAFRHLRVNVAVPLVLRRPSASGSDSRRGKIYHSFCPYTESLDKDRLR